MGRTEGTPLTDGRFKRFTARVATARPGSAGGRDGGPNAAPMPILIDPLFLDTSGANAFDARKRFAAIPEFRIGGRYDLDEPESYRHGGVGGTTLESLGLPPAQIGYCTVGQPHRGANGEIDNAILICPYYTGDSTTMLDYWSAEGSLPALSEAPCLGPGLLFDTDRSYCILVDALGLWGCSKPSSSHPGQPGTRALGLCFPQYSLEDCAQLIVCLLREHLGIGKLKLVTGVSMGAALTYVLGVLHPHLSEALLPIGGTAIQDRGMARWLFDLMTAAIQSDPVYRETGGSYYDRGRLEQPILGNMFGWSLLRQSAYADELRLAQSPEQFMLESFDWELSPQVLATRGAEPGWGQALYHAALTDANDLIYRNRALARHNVLGELHRVRARTLIVHVETDQWLHLHLARRAQEAIAGSRLLHFSHPLGHYAVFSAPHRYREELSAWLGSGKPETA